ncbi:hypothetical protein ZOSMA_16G01690 [Zostera marina]|uniref:Uncharacterized protein n=1 Tax=Zostera marina TaxID=29655 RepID=A0A0K9PVD1_ZOSMR|nr:hypothetical protein ZOSMA_16G01690 [Zostera marina]
MERLRMEAIPEWLLSEQKFSVSGRQMLLQTGFPKQIIADCGFHLANDALSYLFNRFSNLDTLKIDYPGWNVLSDDSLKVLSSSSKLEEFTLSFSDVQFPLVSFTLDGIVSLIQTCPIRVLVLRNVWNTWKAFASFKIQWHKCY